LIFSDAEKPGQVISPCKALPILKALCSVDAEKACLGVITLQSLCSAFFSLALVVVINILHQEHHETKIPAILVF